MDFNNAMRCRQQSVEQIRGCKIYLWEPSGILSAGHIALELPNKMYISFWPRPKGKKGTLKASGTVYCTVAEEIKVNGEPRVINIPSGLDCEKIVSWWAQFLDEKLPQWNVLQLNCSNVVYDALCQGSDWFNNRTSHILPTTPHAVAAIVEQFVSERD